MRAMILVMGAILLTSPLATALETALLRASEVNPDRFMFELGAAFGPRSLQLAIVIDRGGAAAGRGQHRPHRLLPRVPGAGPARLPAPLAVGPQPASSTRPHRAIAISVLAPVLVVAASRAQLGILGEIYTFGLLGAFTLTSVGLDKVKWQERVRGIGFYLGIVDVGARGQRVGDQPRAPPASRRCWAARSTALGCAYAIAVKKGWLGAARSGFVAPRTRSAPAPTWARRSRS